MDSNPKRTSQGSKKLREAVHLQALEGNPLQPDEIAMFEMFERENWSDARRRDYIHHRMLERFGVPAAE